MKKKKYKVFIDGEVLVHEHFSGIGHYTAGLLKAVDALLFFDEYSNFHVEIGVPYKHIHKLGRYNFNNFGIRRTPLPIRIANGLKRRHLLPPIDLLYGRKAYVFPNYSSWPTLFSPAIPIIYDLSFVHHAEFVEPANQIFLLDQVKRSAIRAKKIITISQNSKTEIVKEYGTPPEDVAIINPGVDLHEFYRRSDHEISRVKAKYGVFDNYILFVGNIEPRKNLVTLLKAYQALPKAIQRNYSLLLVGAKGWLDSEIKDNIIAMRLEGLRVIQPTDYVVDKDLPALYSGAGVFAYVSRYEGFGIPPIEAMACGTPVVSSDNSSLPEAVGDAAVLTDAMDHTAIAKGIAKLLDEKTAREKLIDAGYEQSAKFDWNESAKKFLNTIEDSL